MIKYAHAPLTEATIEFRLSEPVPPKVLEAVKNRISRRKWKEEQLLELELVLGTGLPPRQTLVGYKFTSPDGAAVIQTNLTAIGYTALAPYPGWDKFLGDVLDSYAAWRKEVGRRKLGRLGVRYINRFDIPCPADTAVKIADYLTFTTIQPSILDRPITTYQISVNGGINGDDLGVNLSSATVQSPLIDHVSLILDIDIYRENTELAQDDDDLRKLLDLIRLRRTEIFEQCITPASRALIS
jgi:uncharacterized protein (TIGR04255 family)